MTTLNAITNHPVYKQILADSFGGIMYNVDNHSKYNATELFTLWNSLTPVEKEMAGGITKGVFNFLSEVQS